MLLGYLVTVYTFVYQVVFVLSSILMNRLHSMTLLFCSLLHCKASTPTKEKNAIVGKDMYSALCRQIFTVITCPKCQLLKTQVLNRINQSFQNLVAFPHCVIIFGLLQSTHLQSRLSHGPENNKVSHGSRIGHTILFLNTKRSSNILDRCDH